MCGRLACYRDACDYSRSTIYYDCRFNAIIPTLWHPWPKSNLSYAPNPNLQPHNTVPVLIHGNYFNVNMQQVLVPMNWSIIPYSHQDNHDDYGFETWNARIETITKLPTFSRAVARNQRCVIVADGFYKWQEQDEFPRKKPYFVYTQQNEGETVEDEYCYKEYLLNPGKGWDKPEVMKMAGIFDIWVSPKDEVIPNCSIITMAANEMFSSLCDRMPAILHSDRDVKNWLNLETPFNEAIQSLRSSKLLRAHPVRKRVSDPSYSGMDCCHPVDDTSFRYLTDYDF